MYNLVDSFHGCCWQSYVVILVFVVHQVALWRCPNSHGFCYLSFHCVIPVYPDNVHSEFNPICPSFVFFMAMLPQNGFFSPVFKVVPVVPSPRMNPVLADCPWYTFFLNVIKSYTSLRGPLKGRS